MSQLPKIEDRIEIVQNKYSDEYGKSFLRTKAMELPRRIPGFYYHDHLECDDYEFVELDQPLGKVVKDRRVTIKELHDKWDPSQKYLTAQSIEENLFYSAQYRSYPTGYQYRTEFPKFEEGKSALMESLQMLKVANKKLESYDKEINRLAKANNASPRKAKKTLSDTTIGNQEQSLKESNLLSNNPTKLSFGAADSGADTADEILKPWKKNSPPVKNNSSQPYVLANALFDSSQSSVASVDSSAHQTKQAIPEYYYFNADMKRVYQRTKPGIDGTPVLESPYVLDPKRAQESFVLRQYGAASVMNIRPDSLFEISDDKEITEQHMENVVYLQSRKYGYMLDRRTKLRKKQRRGRRSVSPPKSSSHAAALAASSGQTLDQMTPNRSLYSSPSSKSPSKLEDSSIGGGIRPLLNTRHASLIFRDSSSANMFHGSASGDVDFLSAIETAKKVAGITDSNATSMSPGNGTITELDIDIAIRQAAASLAASLADNRIDDTLPLSARKHKTGDVFEDVMSQRLDTPALKRSLSVVGTPSHSLSRRLSRAASRSSFNLNTSEDSTSPSKHLSHTSSPIRDQSMSNSPISSPVVPFSVVEQSASNDANTSHKEQPLSQEPVNRELFSDTDLSTAKDSVSKRISFSDRRPSPLQNSRSQTDLTVSSRNASSPNLTPSNAAVASPSKTKFLLNRKASFVPASAKQFQAPPTIKEESTSAKGVQNTSATTVSEASEKTVEEEEEEIPGMEYLTMMVQRPAKQQRKPSIAFSFNSTTGKIEDIHFQSLQPKKRPHSADLDKSSQRTLLRRLQEKSKAAFEYMQKQRRAKLLHHGKDLSKLSKITPSESERERTALKDLYDICGGRYWERQDNWCSNRPVREWYGVSVNVEGYVFELHLSNNNLTGPFPDTIMFLPALEVINVDYNHLSGELPEYAIQKCNHLTVLSARHNMLSGYIKFDLLTHLMSLREIWLSDNMFDGDIQDGITQMTALTHIDLDNNRLHGSIPRHINRLFNLQHLSLGRNQLTGHIAPAIMSLDRLETLSLYSNRLTGKIPLWLKSMPSLQDFLLFDNCFDEY